MGRQGPESCVLSSHTDLYDSKALTNKPLRDMSPSTLHSRVMAGAVQSLMRTGGPTEHKPWAVPKVGVPEWSRGQGQLERG